MTKFSASRLEFRRKILTKKYNSVTRVNIRTEFEMRTNEGKHTEREFSLPDVFNLEIH